RSGKREKTKRMARNSAQETERRRVMALRQLMLKSKIDKKRNELASLKEKDTDFDTREADLETAIAEAQTEEEQQVVSEQVEKFENEKQTHEAAKEALETEISELEGELER